MMANQYHSVVIGGGILGVAAAVALQRRLQNSGDRVLLIEKRTLGAVIADSVLGQTTRHSQALLDCYSIGRFRGQMNNASPKPVMQGAL